MTLIQLIVAVLCLGLVFGAIDYFRRAFGVDANMRHHLAKLLAKDAERLAPIHAAVAEVLKAAEEHNYTAYDNFECRHGFKLKECPNECVDRKLYDALSALKAVLGE